MVNYFIYLTHIIQLSAGQSMKEVLCSLKLMTVWNKNAYRRRSTD